MLTQFIKQEIPHTFHLLEKFSALNHIFIEKNIKKLPPSSKSNAASFFKGGLVKFSSFVFSQAFLGKTGGLFFAAADISLSDKGTSPGKIPFIT